MKFSPNFYASLESTLKMMKNGLKKLIQSSSGSQVIGHFVAVLNMKKLI
jgi:hypothetical protein